MIPIDRRAFLRRVAGGAAGAAALTAVPWLAGGCGEDPPSRSGARHEELRALRDRIAVARNVDAAAATRAALDRLGGADVFVRSGDRVVLKPNMAWKRRPELAANTNPVVVAALAEAFLAAGAGEVVVLDRACPPRNGADAYRISGIGPAVEAAGASTLVVPERDGRYTTVTFDAAASLPEGKRFPGGTWPILTEALEADLLVNVPVAKDHNQSGVSLGMKNMMGVMGGNRGLIHPFIQEGVALLGTKVRPHLTVLDASRMLLDGGPTGGRLDYVKAGNTVVAGVDPVAVDAYAVERLPWDKGKRRKALTFLDWGARLGVGEADLAKVTILEA